jgi:hypothetical protein
MNETTPATPIAENDVFPVDLLTSFLDRFGEDDGPQYLYEMAHLMGFQCVVQFMFNPIQSFTMKGEVPGIKGDEQGYTVIPAHQVGNKKDIEDILALAIKQLKQTGLTIADPSVYPEGASQRIKLLSKELGGKFKVRLATITIEGEEERPVFGVAFQAGKNGFPLSEDYGTDQMKAWKLFLEGGGACHLFSLPEHMVIPTAMLASKLNAQMAIKKA